MSLANHFDSLTNWNMSIWQKKVSNDSMICSCLAGQFANVASAHDTAVASGCSCLTAK